ncbi:MAG: YlxR family protein [Bacillota bacterium]|uniref:YlxR family protein n=1 Tax=Anoxybacterium hadale TaxID=3408580 RepID=A0ACD1A8D1_9FIRM|nr:YlxR family protein [Bacillota bacterium]QOX62565.1 YlxR family protein [Clostridiales bacterium]
MKTKKVPMRRCVGCMESKPKRELIRIVAADGGPKIDLTGKANGRGIYLCPNTECFTKARKRKAVSRGLEIEIGEAELDNLFKELAEHEKKG